MLWFRVMWLVTSQKTGVSAIGLKNQLGLTRYETVWMWLHKMRRAMVRPGREHLSGTVEVDEMYVGGQETGVTGRKIEKKVLVAIAAEEKKGKRIGRVRMRKIKDASSDSLLPFIEASVQKGSTIHTDAWKGYKGLTARGYEHTISNLSQSGELGHVAMPRVHRVASLFKRWWSGTHQGAISEVHLDYYLDEFTFRFNRRTSRKRGKLFYRLVQQVMNVDPVHWVDIGAGSRTTKK
jgi:transposase-like protein